MPINDPLFLLKNTGPTLKERPRSDLNVPPYDRTNDRGNYLVVSLNNGAVEFSSYCATFSRALAMTRLSKRDPTWVLCGLENELVLCQRMCAMKASWLTAAMLHRLIQTQLGKTIKIATTFNV